MPRKQSLEINLDDDLKTVRLQGRKLIGQAIVASITEGGKFSIGDFNEALAARDYNQDSGNYTQSGGGDYDQDGGGNYNQSAITGDPFVNIRDDELINIRDEVNVIKGLLSGMKG